MPHFMISFKEGDFPGKEPGKARNNDPTFPIGGIYLPVHAFNILKTERTSGPSHLIIYFIDYK